MSEPDALIEGLRSEDGTSKDDRSPLLGVDTHVRKGRGTAELTYRGIDVMNTNVREPIRRSLG
ncbi:hypothetical protein ABZ837_41190 [Streptomyces sp. NPDC047197]|uniref:hypothetical protein n=1 Tax=Streptomyces sp. NPDC047197 TaxID=3155477 RepID=UPI00340182E5